MRGQLARAATYWGSHSRNRRLTSSPAAADSDSSLLRPLPEHASGRCGPVAILLLLLLFPQPSLALPSSLSGTARLVGVNSDGQTTETQSINQEYTLRWARVMAASVRVHAGLRYHRYGADLGEGNQIWREELQPDALLSWQRSWLTLSSNYQYRKSISNDHSTDLIRDRLGFNARSHAFGYPVTNFGVEFNQSYNRLDRHAHDNRRTRVYGNTSYTFGRADLYYSADLSYSRNRAANLKTVEGRHLVRWNQSADIVKDRWRLASTYYFDFRSQGQTALGSDTALRALEPAAGFYAQDPSPELGELESLPGLIDGNYEEATVPAIDIGQGTIDQNVGLDLGYARDVVAFYIYTDQSSGSALRWTLYISSDNVTWQPLTAIVPGVYNSAAFRYELAFDPVKTRYIKAVNGGTNDVLAVHVTEVEAYERITLDKKLTRSRTIHRVDMTSSIDFSEHWQTTFSTNLRFEPKSSFESENNRADLGLIVHHTISERLSQTLRGQVDWDRYQLTHTTHRDRSLDYSLAYKPLKTAGGTFSAQTRFSSEDGLAIQESNTISAQGFVQLLPELKFTSEGGYARSNALLAGRQFTTWTARFATESRLIRSFELSLSTLYQNTREAGSRSLIIRKRYTADGTYHVSASLWVRSSLSLSYDNDRRYMIQDYGLNWLVSRKLSLSAVSQTDSEDSIVRLRRRIVSLTFTASHRTSVYTSYLYTGADEDNRPNLSSFQIGLTTGF